jgi:subtilisin
MADQEDSGFEAQDSGTTGRFIVAFADDAPRDAVARATGDLRMASSSDFGTQSMDVDAVLQEADGIYYETLNVAVLSAPPPARGPDFIGITSADNRVIIASEPERYVFTTEQLERIRTTAEPRTSSEIESSRDYVRGYRDASSNIFFNLFETGPSNPVDRVEDVTAAAAARWADTNQLTWGLIATRVDRSLFTGRGINVAVLDTGIDFTHADFSGAGARTINSSSFITGEPVQDGNGHGTHTTGTSLGMQRPNGTSRRYGVAFESNIFNGKVLSNAGSGSDGGILAGIDWAIRNGCRIVSMSLGGATRPGEAFSTVYETVARRALDQGTIIICAAGNDSSRPGIVRPVSRPANCPSIMAVAAIDNTGAVAAFSNRGSASGGGQVDIAGPGVAVFSSWPRPRNYRTIDGTSMATPHVAGIAALYLQQNPALTARELWRALQTNALRLGGLTVDVGAGLVQSV